MLSIKKSFMGIDEEPLGFGKDSIVAEGLADVLPWVEKYRPRGLGGIVYHAEIIETCIFIIFC